MILNRILRFQALLTTFLLLGVSCMMSAQSTFEEKLAQLGINRENVTDWSDKDNISWPKPQCAYINLTGISNMPRYKTSNLHAWVEVFDGQGNYFKKRALINLQGRGSTALAKKNFKLDFCNDEWLGEDTPDMVFGDWVPQDGFHYKAFYLDLYRGMGIMGYWVYDLITWPRGQYGRIWERANLKNPDERALCHPDAFPCVVYLNGEFHGLFCWQLKKHRKNMNMKKNTPEHIHIEGTRVDGSTLYQNYVKWSVIEVRNPKNLYCMDGSVYDADKNMQELIDETSPYFNLETDDAKTKEYKQNTAKAKAYLQNFSHYYTELINMEAAGASKEEMRAAIEQRFDVPSLIDYIIHNLLTSNGDGLIRNLQWFTYDGVKWHVAPYDLDGIFGYCVPTGNGLFEPGYFQTGRLVDRVFTAPYGMRWAYLYFRKEIYEHYAYLRNNGYLNSEIIANLFDQWYHWFGENNYKDEWIKWPNSKCLIETQANEPWELCPFAQPEYSKLPNYSDTITYKAGQKCRVQSKIWMTKEDVKGVRPYKIMGSKDSLTRMAYYLPIHFAALDKWMHYTFETQAMSYTLNVSTAGWTTLCLPFSFAIPDNLQFYSVKGMREDGRLILVQTPTVEANKPYLVKGKPGSYFLSGFTEEAGELGEDYLRNDRLQGCHVGRYAPQGSYVLQNQNGNVAFYKVEESGTVHVGEHRAWLVADSEAMTLPNAFELDVEDTDCVDVPESQTGQMSVYSADGSLITHPVKGLNIIRYNNGKTAKVIMK